MIKVQVTEQFYLGKFNELQNIVRFNPNKKDFGTLYTNDIFECTEEMLEYLQGKNATGRSFVKVLEIIPAKVETVKPEIKEEPKEEVEIIKSKRKRTNVRKNIVKRD